MIFQMLMQFGVYSDFSERNYRLVDENGV